MRLKVGKGLQSNLTLPRSIFREVIMTIKKEKPAAIRKESEYARWRNQFIGEAVTYANEMVGEKAKIIGKKSKFESQEIRDRHVAQWNLCYHSQMTTLVEQAKIKDPKLYASLRDMV